jgi:hypothetical protein
LPILGSKIYVVWDPVLAQSVFRNSQLSLLPIAVEFAVKSSGLSKQAVHTIQTTDLLDNFNKALHQSLSGKFLPHMNKSSLGYIAEQLNDLPGDQRLEIPNLYRWLRDLITMATVEGLYGSTNLFREEPILLEDFWYILADYFFIRSSRLQAPKYHLTNAAVGSLKLDCPS